MKVIVRTQATKKEIDVPDNATIERLLIEIYKNEYNNMKEDKDVGLKGLASFFCQISSCFVINNFARKKDSLLKEKVFENPEIYQREAKDFFNTSDGDEFVYLIASPPPKHEEAMKFAKKSKEYEEEIYDFEKETSSFGIPKKKKDIFVNDDYTFQDGISEFTVKEQKIEADETTIDVNRKVLLPLTPEVKKIMKDQQELKSSRKFNR